MSVFIKNFARYLEQNEVIALCGNIRDKYIDPKSGVVFDNLNELVTHQVKNMVMPRISQLLFYDPVDREQRLSLTKVGDGNESGKEASPTAANATTETVLARWRAKELTNHQANTVAVINHFNHLICYSQRYSAEEQDILLRLVKLQECITPNNRLILVTLQDTMLPLELIQHSPKIKLLTIPAPDKEDRKTYLRKRCDNFPLIDLAADLTDGLYLRDLDKIITELQKNKISEDCELRRLINKYRLGEPDDKWGVLDLDQLKNSFTWFKKRIKGQDHGISKLVEAIFMARAGLSGISTGKKTKPKGIFFFAGPSGTGKTFTAKKLAEFLFGSEENFIRFDMSEFMEEHSVSKMLGSPPGYVGFERGGLLPNAVREKPFSVILFDEIEKAHPRVLDIFLQVLDEGRITDSHGQTVFFSETVIIFTSNIGTRDTVQMMDGSGLSEYDAVMDILNDETIDKREKQMLVQNHFRKCAENHFEIVIGRPELKGRIGENIIPFNHLCEKDLREIAENTVQLSENEFKSRKKQFGYTLEIDSSIIDEIINMIRTKKENDKQGRKISQFMENGPLTCLAAAVIEAECKGEHNIRFKIQAQKGISDLFTIEKTINQ